MACTEVKTYFEKYFYWSARRKKFNSSLVLRIYKGVYSKIILKIRDKIQCNKNMSTEIIMLMFAPMHLILKT